MAGGYLFTFFAGEQKDGEAIYFSLSRDGLYWEDLNEGKHVLKSDVGTKGVRDPFLIRDEEKGKFVLIGTDLKILGGTGWKDAAEQGSTSIVLWESQDLIHWSRPELVETGIQKAGCVWAPESVYDRDKNSFMVFWSSFVNGKFGIYSAYTRDFKTYSSPEIYLEKNYDVIDMTIFCAEEGYYRFYKDENQKNIHMDYGQSLCGRFEEIESPCLENLYGVEGPVAFRMKDGRICLLVDQFAVNGGYLPLICRNPEKGDFLTAMSGTYDLGETRKRHGSILRITENEYTKLKQKFRRTSDADGKIWTRN